MQKENLSIIEMWKKNRFEERRIEIVQYKNRPFIQIDKRPRIDLTKAIVSRTIEMEIPIEESKKSLCFEVVYDKQFVFFCKDDDMVRYWVNKMALVSKTFGVFGYPLSCAVKKSSWRFPIPVFRSLQYLLTHEGKELEGIFRTNASHVSLSRIKTILDCDQDVDMESFDDCRVAAAILKDYLRQLPEPLIPYEYYKQFIELPLKTTDPKLFMESLPKMNQDTLWYLCSFLYEIQLNEEKTRMNASNLATCIGLTVCRPPPFEGVDELIHTKNAISAFEFVLNNYEPIFFSIKQRNEKEGLIPPEYPCVIPHQKIPFCRLTGMIKTTIKKDSDLPQATPQVRTKAKLSKCNSETNLTPALGIDKNKNIRVSEVPSSPKEELNIEKLDEGTEKEKELEHCESPISDGTTPKIKKEKKEKKGRKGSIEGNINTLIAKGWSKMKFERKTNTTSSSTTTESKEDKKKDESKEKDTKPPRSPRGSLLPSTFKKLSQEKDHKRNETTELTDEQILTQHITEVQINLIEDLKKELVKLNDELNKVKAERDYLKRKYEPESFVETNKYGIPTDNQFAFTQTQFTEEKHEEIHNEEKNEESSLLKEKNVIIESDIESHENKKEEEPKVILSNSGSTHLSDEDSEISNNEVKTNND
ncbi:Rho GTPase activating protein [Entamoeba histolytica HM-3:IMSS]|uniref:Rho GTPase activating protein n=1 Tax=Entamoeba histolytica HM-3:IMSS TaxID=885315 RepID=M7WSI6_ENTHI|nr:Rho GTPase activating protein [Entamoeba histolytica HM-3:IMSS]